MDRTRLQYEAALVALDPLENDAAYNRWMAICQRYSMACLFDSGPAQCEIFRQAEKLADARADTAGRIEAELSLASIYYALGDGVRASTHVSSAKRLGESNGSGPLNNRILTARGQIESLCGEYAAALPNLSTALKQMAPYRKREKVRYSYAYTLATKAMALGDLGQFDQANECFEEAEELTNGPVHQVQGSLMSMHAGVLLWQGNWETALYYALLGIEAGERIGSRYIVASSTALAGYAKWRNGEQEATASVADALKWIETQRQVIWTSMHFGWLSEMAAAHGDVAATRHCAAWVLQRGRQRERLGDATAFCALAAVAESSTGEAQSYFEKALRVAQRRGSPREEALVKFKQTKWQMQSGQTPGDPKLLADCSSSFAEMNMPWYANEAQQLSAQLKQASSG